MKVKLSRRIRTAAKRGVARSRRVKAALRVTATDAAGNLSARKFKIALKK